MKSFVYLLVGVTSVVFAQPNQGGMRQYRDVFHFLLKNHLQIERTVQILPNGVETLTTSEDEEVVIHLQKHVNQMKGLVESGQPIRRSDPLFAAIFQHHHLIEMKVENIPSGVKVIETSVDPMVAELVKAHAQVVSLFVEYGFEEARRSHPVP